MTCNQALPFPALGFTIASAVEASVGTAPGIWEPETRFMQCTFLRDSFVDDRLSPNN